MRNTGSSGRSKSTKDKGSTKVTNSQNHTSNTVKSEGPPVKQIVATAEQLALNNLIQGKDSSDDEEQKRKILQIQELTGCTQESAVTALHDNKNDMDKAVNQILEGGGDQSEWQETGKKKKKQKSTDPPTENHVDSKPEKRENRDRSDRDNRDRDRDRNKDEKDYNSDRGSSFNRDRDSSDNYRRPRRNDNRPPRLSRGRGRPDRAGDRPDGREDDVSVFDKDENRDRGFDRGRGRGRGGFGPRRGGRGGPGGAGSGFRPPRSDFQKPTQFDNGPQIDTWTNETAVIGEKEPKISNWGDSKDDWNEDIDSWTGSVSSQPECKLQTSRKLAETKVFTASANTAPEPPSTGPLEPNTLADTFDLGSLYPKHPQTADIGGEQSYISQFNQQATESIKNSIGIGSGPSSTLQSSMTSQTASNVSALVSLTQNALQDNLSSSLNVPELTGNRLGDSSLTVGTSLGSSSSLPVNSFSTSLSGELPGTGLSGNSLSGSGMGTKMSVSLAAPGLSGASLAPGAQSVTSTSASLSATQSQNAILQQRAKPQKSKLPPPSKIPASAVEMPGKMTQLDVQFGTLEFGSDATPFSFGGNESAPNAFSTVETNSTSTLSNHVGSQQQSSMNKAAGESMMSTGLEQTSPRSSTLYQQAPYTTPTKQNPADTPTKINSPPEPLQMPNSNSDLKSNQLITGQTTQVSLPTSKMDSSLGSYSSNSSYQSSGYQSQKPSTGYQSSSKPGSYPGNQSSASQFSSQYRQTSQNQFQSGSSQFQSGSQYQSPPAGYQSNQTGYSSTQSGFQSNQSQYQSGQNQYQNFQSGSTFPSQTGYSSSQSNQSSLYPSSTTSSFSNQSQQNSLYSQNTRQGSYSNQPYMNHDSSSFQTSVTRSSSPFKDTQSGASSFREGVTSSSKRDSQSESGSYSRDTNSASSFSDSQSLAYNRDSQSGGSSYTRENSYKRDSKSASGSYPRDTSSNDSASYNRDSQSASASFPGTRDTQGSSSGYRETQSGAAGFGNQAGSYPRDSGSSQTQTGFNPKPFRNTVDASGSLSSGKLSDGFSKMAVNDNSLDSRTTNSQFDVSVTSNKSSSLTSNASTVSGSMSSMTVTSSTTTKISTLPTASNASSNKAPPNLPPGVPPSLMTQPYIMGQTGTLPFYGLQGLQQLAAAQQPVYPNMEDFQYLQQRMPPALATSNMYDLSAVAAAAGIQMPPTTLTSNSTPQTVPAVPFSVSADASGKLPRVDAQSPTGSVQTTTPSVTGQTQHQQPYGIPYGYYPYPPSLIPGAGFQYPMVPVNNMPQVTNAAHTGTPANSQYQQKSQYVSHVPYGTNKGVYDELTGVQSGADFPKSPYGSSQSQPKQSANSSGSAGSGSNDIQLPGGYGKTHAQAFEKQAFHAGTPPPFGLQMAGQLATGTQAGPLGGPGAPYATPLVPFLAHQPHSQMMHPPLQDTTSSRGSQQSSSASKSSGKTFSGSTSWAY